MRSSSLPTVRDQVQAEADYRVDPELWELLSQLPFVLQRHIRSLGAETCSDVVGLWPQAQWLLNLLHELCDDVDPERDMEAARIWTRMAARARRKHTEAVTAIASCRESSFLAAATVESERLPPTGIARAFRAGDGDPTAAPLVVTSGHTPTDAWAREEATKKLKLDQLFTIMWEFVIDPKEIGVEAVDLSEPIKRDLVKGIILCGAERLSTQRLGALVSSFKRWIRYCREQDWDPKRPTPYQMASFLQFVSRGGPTAAASMHAVFKWYETNGGSQFRTAHPVIANFRFHRAGHTSRQAPELEPWEMVNLLLLLHRAKGTHKIVVALIVMSACSCIRWEHIQRSTLVTNHKDWLEMKCAQGKTRRNGARPAYHWACPNISWRGMQLQKILSDFWQFETLADKGFLVPAVELNAEDLWELAENTALVLDRAMSRSRFLELFRGALLECGVDKTTACGATFNRLRRFLPTLGNVCQISDHEAQAIGNWVEMPQGGGGVNRPKAMVHMGLHYSGQRTLQSAQVKIRLWKRFMFLWEKYQPECTLNGEGLLPHAAWTWPGLQSLHLLHPWPDSVHEPVAEPPPAAEEAHTMEAVADEAEPEPDDEEMPSDESSLSGSEKSAEGDDLLGILADDEAGTEIQWFKQGAKTHIAREVTEENRMVPYCRDSAFSQDPVRQGEGFVSGGVSSVCSRCLTRMPRGLYQAIADYNGWLHWPPDSVENKGTRVWALCYLLCFSLPP